MTQNENTKTKSLSRRKKIAIAVISVLAVLSIIAIIVASVLIKTKKVTLDGETYYAKPEDGVYSLFSENGEKLETTSDGYYILNSGSLASLDKNTGDAEIYIRIDISGTEELSSDGMVLIFEHLSSDDVKKISVKNEEGEYALLGAKNANGEAVFSIEGYKDTTLDGNKRAMLLACAGYTKAKRIDKEISLDRFGWSEYGLEAERASYTIETFEGNTYTVWIGDKTQDGLGYYVRLKSDDRYALYILTATDYIEDTLLSPIESMVAPLFNISYYGENMSTAYLDVQNCKLTQYTYGEDGEAFGEVLANFSYFTKMPDGSSRLDGEYKSQPFIGLDDMSTYIPSANAINEMMYNLSTMTPLGTMNLGTSSRALREYGLDKPMAVLEFEHTDTDEKGNEVFDRQVLYFSHKTENNTYYAYSEIERNGEILAKYNQIVELDAGMLDFLSYSKSGWVEANYFYLYSEFCRSIEITRGSDKYVFELDHESGDEDIITVVYNGNRTTLLNEDKNYYDANGDIQTASKSKSLFNSFYVMLETSAFVSEHGLTDSEKQACMVEENLSLSIKITTTSGRIMTFQYYKISDLRSVLKLSVENAPYTSGNHESSDFYAVSSRADKIWEDAGKLLQGAKLFASGDYEEYSKITISSSR